MYRLLLSLSTCIALVGLGVGVAHAADTTAFVPLAPVGTGASNLSGLYSSNGDFATYINKVFQFAIAIGAMAAVLRLVYAGYLYMGSADMWSSKSEAKHIISDVTLGLFLLLAVWLILYQINPDILKLDALRNIQASPAPAAPSATTGPF